MPQAQSRRAMIKTALGYCALIPVAALMACKGRVTCDDTSGLSPDDIKQRQDQNYLDTASDPTKVCRGCAQNQPAPQADSCGTCKVIKGPINPSGSCKLWAAKT